MEQLSNVGFTTSEVVSNVGLTSEELNVGFTTDDDEDSEEVTISTSVSEKKEETIKEKHEESTKREKTDVEETDGEKRQKTVKSPDLPGNMFVFSTLPTDTFNMPTTTLNVSPVSAFSAPKTFDTTFVKPDECFHFDATPSVELQVDTKLEKAEVLEKGEIVEKREVVERGEKVPALEEIMQPDLADFFDDDSDDDLSDDDIGEYVAGPSTQSVRQDTLFSFSERFLRDSAASIPQLVRASYVAKTQAILRCDLLVGDIASVTKREKLREDIRRRITHKHNTIIADTTSSLYRLRFLKHDIHAMELIPVESKISYNTEQNLILQQPKKSKCDMIKSVFVYGMALTGAVLLYTSYAPAQVWFI